MRLVLGRDPAPVVEPSQGPPQKVDRVVKRLRLKTEVVAQTPPTEFRVSTFNVLGHSHTRPGGNKKGWASAVTRTRWAFSLLNSYGVDVVGLQEFEDLQVRTFQGQAGGAVEEEALVVRPAMGDQRRHGARDLGTIGTAITRDPAHLSLLARLAPGARCGP